MSPIFTPLLIGSTAADILPTNPTKIRKRVDPIVADDGLIVPVNYVSDGASIPRPFWFFVGHPFEGLFIRPAFDHDVRCELRVGRWRHVHDRFFDTLEAEGVGKIRCNVMWRAVRTFGPKWPLHQARTVGDVLPLLTGPLAPNGRPWGEF